MHHYDLKLYFLNAAAIGITFTSFDAALKLFTTLVAIGYTLHKWYFLIKDRREKKQSNIED